MISDSLKMILVLTLVGLLSGGFLTVVYQKTAPEIEQKSQEALREAIFMVLPEAQDYREIKLGLGEEVIYQGIDKHGRKVGIALLAEGSGFQGEIKIMVGLKQNLDKMQYFQVLESIETPGLGGRITEDDFKEQFKGLTVKDKIKLVKGARPKHLDAISRATVQAITGATISSKAIVEIINQRVAVIKQLLEEQK